MSTEIHQGLLSVRWFAAVGDGSDETAKIQAALDHPTTDAVFFHRGDYWVTGLLVSRAKKIVLDRGASIHLLPLSNTNVFHVLVGGVTIEGEGVINGERDDQTSGSGIYVDAVDDVKIRGVTITDCAGSGVYAHDCSRVHIEGITVARTDATGIFIQAVFVGSDMEDNRVVGCNVDRSDASTNSEKCIAITRDNGTRNITHPLVLGNRCKMSNAPSGPAVNVICIELFASELVSGISHGRIEANSTEGADIGISIASRAEHCTIQNNITMDANSIGVEIADARYCSIVGNTIDGQGNTGTGISVDGVNVDAAGCTVVGNTVRNVTSAGILAIAGTPYLSISGNVITISEATAQGIRLTGVSDDVRISGNTVDGATTSETCLFIGNSSRVYVNGNTLRRSANFAVQIAADGVVVTDIQIAPSNLLQGTNGKIQLLEQNGGTLTSVDIGDQASSPAAITVSQNNYAAGPYRRLRLTSTGSVTITGFAGGFDGLRKTVMNVGSNEIILADQSGSSSAANQIDTGSGAAVSLLAGDCAELVYDGSSSLWRVVGTN